MPILGGSSAPGILGPWRAPGILTSSTVTLAFARASLSISDWWNGTTSSASPWISRNGGSSEVAWLKGEASRASRISWDWGFMPSRTLAPSNRPVVAELMDPGSAGVARATTAWTLAERRLISLSSSLSPVPSSTPSMETRCPPDEPPNAPIFCGLMPYLSA